MVDKKKAKNAKTRDKNVQLVKSKDFFERLYRGMATLIVKVLVHTPVTANMVTIFRGLFFIPFCLIIAIYPLIGFPAWAAYLIAFLGVQIWDTLDCVDGQLARARKSASNLGEWMELVVDRPLGNLVGLFGFCLALGIFFETGNILIWLFYFMISVGWFLKITMVHIDVVGEIPAEVDSVWRTEARKKKESWIGKILFFFHYRELGVFNILALLFWPIATYLGINIMVYYLMAYAVIHNLIWIAVALIQFQNLKKSK